MKLLTRILLAAGVLAYGTTVVLLALSNPVAAQINVGGGDALNNPVVSGQLSIANGSQAAPGLIFTGTDTGIYGGDNDISFGLSNARILRIDAGGLVGVSGSLASPTYSFAGDPNTGVFLGGPSATALAFVQNGKDLGVWKVAAGEIANAALKTLNATPVEIIATPGSGNAIIVESSRFMLEHATADFDGVAAGEDLVVEYTGGLDLQTCDNSTCLDAAASADSFGYVLEPTTALGSTPVGAAAVDLTILNGEWFASAGGGSLHYHVRYRVVTLDLS